MFSETTIFHAKTRNHPPETTILKWMYSSYLFLWWSGKRVPPRWLIVFFEINLGHLNFMMGGWFQLKRVQQTHKWMWLLSNTFSFSDLRRILCESLALRSESRTPVLLFVVWLCSMLLEYQLQKHMRNIAAGWFARLIVVYSCWKWNSKGLNVNRSN